MAGTNKQFLEYKFESDEMLKYFLDLCHLYYELNFSVVNDGSYTGIATQLGNAISLWVRKLNGAVIFNDALRITLIFIDARYTYRFEIDINKKIIIDSEEMVRGK